MALKQEDRYGNAEEFLFALEEKNFDISRSTAGHTELVTKEKVVKKVKRKKAFLIFIVLLVVVVLLSIATYCIFGARDNSSSVEQNTQYDDIDQLIDSLE